MSTKIYNGLRIPKSKLDNFRKWFDGVCVKECVRMLRNEMACVYESEVRQDFEKAHPESILVRNRSIDECMKDEYAVNWVRISHALHHNIIPRAKQGVWGSIDCSFSAFDVCKYYLIRPFYPSNNLKLKFPKYVEEYGYYDNTDRPHNITAKAWKKREKDWNVVDGDGSVLKRIDHILVDGKDSIHPGMPMITRMVLGKP